MKRLIAALLAGLTLFALVGCSAGSKADSAAPKDYSQILHDARTDEENEYDMIFTKGEDGKFTAIDGYSAEYEAGQLDDEVRSILLPLLNLEDDMYTDLAASVSSMMVRSYAVAIVKPAEGKTDAVKSALEAYVTSEQQSMEHYLEDQYQIAKAATVTVANRCAMASTSALGAAFAGAAAPAASAPPAAPSPTPVACSIASNASAMACTVSSSQSTPNWPAPLMISLVSPVSE